MDTKTNNTWRVTRVLNTNTARHVSPVGEFTSSNVRGALILASGLGGVAKFKGTETHGEFRWGDVCYRAVPCRPTPDKTAEKALQERKDAAKLAAFFPPVR